MNPASGYHSSDSEIGQLFFNLLGAQLKRLQVLRKLATAPTPILGVFMDGEMVWQPLYLCIYIYNWFSILYSLDFVLYPVSDCDSRYNAEGAGLSPDIQMYYEKGHFSEKFPTIMGVMHNLL